jgi:hypothetical protein
MAAALSRMWARGSGALGRIIAIFHDDRCVHHMNIGLDVHGVNVVGNRSVMGEQTSRAAFGRRQAAVGFPITSLREGPARQGRVAIAAVLDRTAARGSWGALVHPNCGSVGFRDISAALGRGNQPRNEELRFARNLF